MRLDVIFTLRLLKRHWGLFSVALGGLALAIAVSTVAFTIADGMLFRPVGVADPQSAVQVWRVLSGRASATWPFHQYRRIRAAAQQVILEAWVELRSSWAITSTNEAARPITVQLVSGAFFATFGGTAAIGRTSMPDDDVPTAPLIAVLNYQFWQRELSGDPSIIGRDLYVAGRPVRVVGVAERGFNGPTAGLPPALWLPLQSAHGMASEPSSVPGSVEAADIRVVGRLKTGVTPPQAQAELTAIAAGLGVSEASSGPAGAVLRPLQARSESDTIVFSIIIAAICLVLLLAALNAAILLLALAITRRSEIGIRLAIGINRFQLARQCVVESTFVSAIGGASGLAAAYWLSSWIAAVIDLPPTIDFVPGTRAVLLAAIMTSVAGLIAGLLPLRFAIFETSPLQTHTVSVEVNQLRRFRYFLGLQAATSVAILILGGLCARALLHVWRFDFGFEVNRLAAVNLPGSESLNLGDYWIVALNRVRTLPDVESAALALYSPLTPRDGNTVHVNLTSVDFFKTMGFRFVRGRGYTPDEASGPADVAVITSNLSRSLWGEDNPIGRTLGAVDVRMRDVVVIGVIEDAVTNRIGSKDSGTAYRPLTSVTDGATLIARSRGEAGLIVPQLNAVMSVMAQDRHPHVWALSESRDTQFNRIRLAGLFAWGLAGLALAFSVVGITGVTVFIVRQRQKEIVIRIAVGATVRSVTWLCVRDSLRPMVGGLAAGLVLALLGIPWLAGPFLATELAGTNPRDPLAVTLAVLFLTAVSLLAVLVASRRSVCEDPARILRA